MHVQAKLAVLLKLSNLARAFVRKSMPHFNSTDHHTAKRKGKSNLTTSYRAQL